jgi:hypothetical protein
MTLDKSSSVPYFMNNIEVKGQEYTLHNKHTYSDVRVAFETQ